MESMAVKRGNFFQFYFGRLVEILQNSFFSVSVYCIKGIRVAHSRNSLIPITYEV